MPDTPSNPIVRQENGTIEINLTLPWEKIKDAYEKQVLKAVNEAELPGFRKGKAPRSMVEPKLDKNHIYSHVIQELLPDIYAEVVKNHELKPILYPRIQIVQGDEGKEWKFIATTCEAPQVILENYQDELKKVEAEPKDSLLGRRVDKLLEIAELSIPSILVDEEVNHRLSSLADNLTKLGLNTESYLQSKKLTPETLRSQLASEAEHDLKVEFVLSHVQRQEKLQDRSKTLDFLTNLV